MGDRGNSFTQFNFILALIDGDYESWKQVKPKVYHLGGRNLKYRFNDTSMTKHVSVEFISHAAVLNSIIEVTLFYREQGFNQRFLEWSDGRNETIRQVKREMAELLA